MTGVIAYHLIWTTYGSWLPGDERGWTDGRTGCSRDPDPALRRLAEAAMRHDAVLLTPAQASAVEGTIRRHCAVRRWTLHAIHVGAVHVHVVLAADRPAGTAVSELKSWCSRTLNGTFGKQAKWWTESGYSLWIDDEAGLTDVIDYVANQRWGSDGVSPTR